MQSQKYFLKKQTDYNPSYFWTVKNNDKTELASLLLFANLEQVFVPNVMDVDNLTKKK